MSDLYEQRNKLLHRATSYRADDWETTKKERVRCFVEADKLTQQIELERAERTHTTPHNYNLYDSCGAITHMLQSSDGVTSRYVRIADWVSADVKIKQLTPLERLRHHETSASKEELTFRADINRLNAILNP